LQSLWRQKLLLTVLLNLAFWAGYSLFARTAFFPLRTPPRTWLDAAIPFQPEPWAWIYLSLFVVASVLPWLIDSRDVLRRYVTGFAVMSVVSFAVFFFFPVASPRTVEPATAGGAIKWILTFDGPMNAFPSLHAAFLAYLARLTWRMFQGKLSRWSVAAGVVWGAAILYATIATRQHYAIDLMAGASIGVLADWLAWRRASGVRAATTMSRSSDVAFHEGCK
jgi:membrane-associated phospholipid phosphatase